MIKKDLLQESNISTEVLNTVDAVILVMDKKGHIVLFNKAAESLTGYQFKDVKYLFPWDIFIPFEEIKQVKHVFSQLTAGNFPNKHTNYWVTKDRNKRLIDWSNTAITDNNGDIAFIIATGIDVTEKVSAELELKHHINNLEETIAKRTTELLKANEKLENLANIDGLTNIYNRRYFNEVIEVETNRAKRSSEPISILMCDVDFFKNYNDSYGHVAGDNCLIKIAATLKVFFNRASDFAARYGGEEFVVILPGIDAGNASKLANKLILEIQNQQIPHDSSSISNVITISIGMITKQPGELTNSTSLIEEADQALYQAKNKGRNRVQVYST